MLLADFSISPLDKGGSVSEYVARAIDVVDRSGLPYRLGPMGTCLEGEWDEVMAVVRACFENLSRDCDRVTISFKGDWRRGHSGRLEAKVATVERRLGRSLRT